ncbi:MAG TPA: transglutaminase family protein [Actinomycetes bacterium]|nr:transglutaminase family protein [Actinomycetes bacterium]
MTTATRYRVVHATEYVYDDDVTGSYGQARLRPRDLPSQTCRSSTVYVDPRPEDVRDHTDHFGNVATYFHVAHPHTRLTVTSTSVVDVSAPALPVTFATQPWEVARDTLAEPYGPHAEAREFALASPRVGREPAVAAYARSSFPARRPIGEAVLDLVQRIHADFRYEHGETTVTTTLPEVLESRVGVCQDFAHLLVGCLRSVGLAARYVSGYLETQPPPGRARLVGADASHAWASVLVPGSGWVGVDPTNDQLVDGRYVTLAWGRDYDDVPPLKGVIFTESTRHLMQVRVDVLPVGEVSPER